MSGHATTDQWDAYVGAVLAASGSILTVAEAARLMKLEPEQIEDMIVTDRLLAVRHSGELRIPMAQLTFRSEPDRLEVVDGIAEVVALMAIRERKEMRRIEALQFLAYRHPAINMTPFEALRNRRADRVIGMAMARLELDQLEAEAHETVVRLDGSGQADEPSKAYVFARAVDVFGSRDAAVEWLLKPALALNRQRPLELLETPEGLQHLRTLLIQLDYGVYI
jgi:chromosome segregation and condensation protein ScpB